MSGKNEPVCFWVGADLFSKPLALENYVLRDYVNVRADFDKRERLGRISLESIDMFGKKYGEFSCPYNTPISGSMTAYFSDDGAAHGDRYILESLRELEHRLEKNAIEIAIQRGCDAIILDYGKTKVNCEFRGGENNFKQWFCKAKFHYDAVTTAMLADKTIRQKTSNPASKPKSAFHTIGSSK